MLRDAARGQFNVVMAWSVDRLGRSLLDLVSALQELHAAKVDLFLHQQALDTTTPAGKAMFGMMGVFAEFERSMIVARVNAGIARARASGTKSARPRTPAARWNNASGNALELPHSAAKAQIFQRTIAPPRSDDGPQIGGRLMVTGGALDQEAEPAVLPQHAARGREAIGHFLLAATRRTISRNSLSASSPRRPCSASLPSWSSRCACIVFGGPRFGSTMAERF